jgi:hypothetical protein
MNLTDTQVKLILGLIGLIIVYFVITSIFKKLGIIKSKEVIAAETSVQEFRELEYFNPAYSKGKNFRPLSPNEVKTFSDRLFKAVRNFGTNEEEIFSVFKQIHNKCQVSQIAEQYFIDRKQDLRARLLEELGKKEMLVLTNILAKLPDSMDDFS